MKKRFWILLTAAVLAMALMGAAAAAAVPERREESTDPAQAPFDGYILTEYEGELGVLRGGELILRSGIAVESLRETDRELVRRGIRSESYLDLLGLLEDFGA